MPRVSPAWLRLREAADAAARVPEFVDLVRERLDGSAAGHGRVAGRDTSAAGRDASAAGRETSAAGHGRAGRPVVIHDLGSGTGSMGRWLAARLPGPQHWILHDRDAELLRIAAANMIDSAADGAPVTVETRVGDISRLTAADLSGAFLVTASALLDLLTKEELGAVAAACVGAGCPALLTISVTGLVELTPGDPMDAEVASAFNAHQRRTVRDRRLLGPDAVDAAIELFSRLGAEVLVRPSPWRLGPVGVADEPAARAADEPAGRTVGGGAPSGAGGGAVSGAASGAVNAALSGAEGYAGEQAELIVEWLTGWVGAACEQRPDLTEAGVEYAARRRAEGAAGRLGVTLDHSDLFIR
ncbi:class I SAM-dependent methyltransferase [Rugosimonospora africana]|uniref:Methyltransferase domain-containing protein n=1 Tax=Rugosimonospora africana TaxID=556532 RepID=A0A8J3VRK7_9ACTN|nr:hypothetical protein Raf01_44140 [Rugosimonospora africana]